MSVTAIIAGQGALPACLASALKTQGKPYITAELDGFPADLANETPIRFRIERLAPFLDQLADKGVTRVVFGGAIRRPKIEPELIDPRTATLVPRLVAGMSGGDDAALRTVISIFEEWSFEVIGADAVAPDLVPGAGILAGDPSEADRRDVARAAGIVADLGALDIGQGAVVAQGLCLAVETLPGTDAMLEFVKQHAGLRPNPNGAKGVLFKAPKPGQDRRIDLPMLGPTTLRAVAKAGLAGIAWEAGGAMLLERAAMTEEAARLGLFLWAREP